MSLQLWVYASPKQLVQRDKMELLWREADLRRGNTVTRYTPHCLLPHVCIPVSGGTGATGWAGLRDKLNLFLCPSGR